MSLEEEEYMITDFISTTIIEKQGMYKKTPKAQKKNLIRIKRLVIHVFTFLDFLQQLKYSESFFISENSASSEK